MCYRRLSNPPISQATTRLVSAISSVQHPIIYIYFNNKDWKSFNEASNNKNEHVYSYFSVIHSKRFTEGIKRRIHINGITNNNPSIFAQTDTLSSTTCIHQRLYTSQCVSPMCTQSCAYSSMYSQIKANTRELRRLKRRNKKWQIFIYEQKILHFFLHLALDLSRKNYTITKQMH